MDDNEQKGEISEQEAAWILLYDAILALPEFSDTDKKDKENYFKAYETVFCAWQEKL